MRDQCGDIFDAHPQFVAAFRAGLDRIAALPCEILITTHTQSAGSLLDRLDGKAPLLADVPAERLPVYAA